MGFFAAIGSALSSVGSAIGSAVGSIGSALSSFASSVAPVLAEDRDRTGAGRGGTGQVCCGLAGAGHSQAGREARGHRRTLQASERSITPSSSMTSKAIWPPCVISSLTRTRPQAQPAEKLIAGVGVCTVAMERKYSAAPGSLDTLAAAHRQPGLFHAGAHAGHREVRLHQWGCTDLSGAAIAAGDSRRLEEALIVGSGSKDAHYEALDHACRRWEQLGKMIESNGKEHEHGFLLCHRFSLLLDVLGHGEAAA